MHTYLLVCLDVRIPQLQLTPVRAPSAQKISASAHETSHFTKGPRHSQPSACSRTVTKKRATQNDFSFTSVVERCAVSRIISVEKHFLFTLLAPTVTLQIYFVTTATICLYCSFIDWTAFKNILGLHQYNSNFLKYLKCLIIFANDGMKY